MTRPSTPVASPEMIERDDPTQRGDETAAKMRAYFEQHKREPYCDEAADDLMIGLMNIVLAEYRVGASDEVLREPTDAMIEAGIDACQQLRDAMAEREASAHPHDLPDYDEGDVMRSIYLAMHAKGSPAVSDEVLREALAALLAEIGKTERRNCKAVGIARAALTKDETNG